MAGGGGSSGSVVYPDHMLAVHHYLLTGAIYPGGGKWAPALRGDTSNTDVDPDVGIMRKVVDSAAVNPYTGEDGYTGVDTHITSLDAIATEYEAAIDAYQSSDETEEVSNYAFDLRGDVNQALNQIAGRFYEINAVAGSQFDSFNAIIMARHLKDIDDFRRNYRNNRQSEKLEHEKALALIKYEIEKVKVSLKIEEYNTGIDFNVKENTWDLEVYREAGNILGSIAGSATTTQREKNRIGSTIAGGIGGMAVGASLFGSGGALAGGAIGGPAGLALGGIIGGIGGLLG